MSQKNQKRNISFKKILFLIFFTVGLGSFVLALLFFITFLNAEHERVQLATLQELAQEFQTKDTETQGALITEENCLKSLTLRSTSHDITQLSLFSEKGELMCSIYKEENLWKEFSPLKNKISLTSDLLDKLKTKPFVEELQASENHRVNLISTSQIQGDKKNLFYLEKTRQISEDLNPNRFILLLKGDGTLLGATSKDLKLYDPETLKKLFVVNKTSLSSLVIRDLNYNYSVFKLNWGSEDLFLAIGINEDQNKISQTHINHRLMWVGMGFLVILFMGSRLLSQLLVRPMVQLGRFLKLLPSKDEMQYLSLGGTQEFQAISDHLNHYNQITFDQKKDLKKRIFELENTKKNLNRMQEEMVSLAPLISAGEKIYLILNQLVAAQKSNPSTLQEVLLTAQEQLQLKDLEKEDIDIIQTIEFELADLTMKGRWAVSVERLYDPVPFISGHRAEFRLAMRKLLALILESMNPLKPLKMSLKKNQDTEKEAEINIIFEFVSKSKTFDFKVPSYSKSLFIRNHTSTEVTELSEEVNSNVRVKLWMNSIN